MRMFAKLKTYKSKNFRRWAKRQGGVCCVCNENTGHQLHHFGPRGIGQKATDLLLCRVCQKCHDYVGAKRRNAFSRKDELDTWVDMLEDGLELLRSYVEFLERSTGLDLEFNDETKDQDPLF